MTKQCNNSLCSRKLGPLLLDLFIFSYGLHVEVLYPPVPLSSLIPQVRTQSSIPEAKVAKSPKEASHSPEHQWLISALSCPITPVPTTLYALRTCQTNRAFKSYVQTLHPCAKQTGLLWVASKVHQSLRMKTLPCIVAFAC